MYNSASIVVLYRLCIMFLNLSMLIITLQTVTFLLFYVTKLFILSTFYTAFVSAASNRIYCIRVK
jgi:hypothetical protein